uniref:U1-type domain-containing protein n=1 Tax=Amphimedon queenslandica TaxID=400682 RepID=A0A1X7TX16_AMPQE
MSSSSGSASDSGSSSTSVANSLLDRLRPPNMSELGRKRKIHSNPPPPVGKKRSIQNFHKSDPKSVSPSQRVKDFPGEELLESAGKLFCRACRETLAVKRSVVRNHIASKKHQDSKANLKTKKAKEQDIANALHAHDAETHRKGETLPDEVSVYRVKVAMTFMKCGIPIMKCGQPDLRSLLEDGAYRLTDPRCCISLLCYTFRLAVRQLHAAIHSIYDNYLLENNQTYTKIRHGQN